MYKGKSVIHKKTSDFVNASPKFNQLGSLFCPKPMKPLP